MTRDRSPLAARRRDALAPSRSLDALLDAWQSTGDEQALESLLRAAVPIIEQSVRRALHATGIRDPAAADDAVALVLDHLRRLHGAAAGEARVAAFAAASDERPGRSDTLAFLRLLARSRARDVARSHRRVARHVLPFSAIDGKTADQLQAIVALARADDPEPAPLERLHAAIGALEPRERTAISLRLEGKSLAVIAHVLGVCAGTASRIHARAVARLRAALTAHPAR